MSTTMKYNIHIHKIRKNENVYIPVKIRQEKIFNIKRKLGRFAPDKFCEIK